MKKRIFKSKEIVYKKKDHFLAVSLDFDLMAEGGTMDEALERLHDATQGYLAMCLQDHEQDVEIYRKADKKFFALYDLFKELNSGQAIQENFASNERIASKLIYA